jgi:hypothetical protein
MIVRRKNYRGDRGALYPFSFAYTFSSVFIDFYSLGTLKLPAVLRFLS